MHEEGLRERQRIRRSVAAADNCSERIALLRVAFVIWYKRAVHLLQNWAAVEVDASGSNVDVFVNADHILAGIGWLMCLLRDVSGSVLEIS